MLLGVYIDSRNLENCSEVRNRMKVSVTGGGGGRGTGKCFPFYIADVGWKILKCIVNVHYHMKVDERSCFHAMCDA